MPENKLKQMMEAIARDDLALFTSDASEQFKTSVTQENFDQVVKLAGTLIKEGYESTYLTELNQQGYKTHVWKISFEGSGNDTLAKLTLDGNETLGFWLQ